MEKSARKPVAKRISQAVLEAGYGRGRVSELARELGLATNSVYRIQRGTMAPSIFTLAAIARLTGRPMEWFVEPFHSKQTTLSVFHAWKRKHPEAADSVATLEGLELGGAAPTMQFYDVAWAALAAGLTAEQAVRAAMVTLSGA